MMQISKATMYSAEFREIKFWNAYFMIQIVSRCNYLAFISICDEFTMSSAFSISARLCNY